MSLKQWFDNGWLRHHKTSRQEVANLLALVRRDLQDAASIEISGDWRFGIAYNAALKLCTILLYASGYRSSHNLAHYRTLQALPLVLGVERTQDANYLNACRIKRNAVEYDHVGGATEKDADELLVFVNGLLSDVLLWLDRNVSHLLPDGK